MTPQLPPTAPTRPHTWDRPTGPTDDPYAWLRDKDDPATIAYLEAENEYAGAFFSQPEVATTVDAIYGEIRSRVQETDLSVPVHDHGWWYVTRTIEGLNYPLFCRSEHPEDHDSDEPDPATVMLDCNAEAVGHDYFDVHTVDPSPDHRLLAWSSDTAGSELYTLRVRDLATGDDLPDELAATSSWGGVAWSTPSTGSATSAPSTGSATSAPSTGSATSTPSTGSATSTPSTGGEWLFYARPDEQMRPAEIWRHRLGTPTEDDVLVMAEPDERFYLGVESTRSEQWIVITAASKTSSEVHVLPAGNPTGELRLVRARADGVEYSVDDWGDRFVILTNLDAADFRVMTATHDEPGTWSELVAHEAGRRITNADPFANHLAIHEWREAQPRIRVLRRDGSSDELDFGPEPHDLELGANPDWNSTTLRVSYQSLTTPASVWDCDLTTGGRVLRKQTPTPGVDLDAYVGERSWATAPDGTKVPVDIVRHRDTPVDGSAPAVVYAYGSYEASLAPWFSVARLSLLDRGVVWALAHPRGGGELGRAWYLDGKLLNKRNTFVDVIAVADHLVETGVADGERVAVRGGSAGGLMVGACITMRPERFASAVAEVPFVDIVTTMSDPTLPLTVTEWEEWGDPREDPFAGYMLAYSPYDNTVDGDASRWPAIFVTAGLNDPRVSFHEPAKWVARLRSVGAGTIRPLVMRTEMGAGHGGPSGRYEAWKDEARTLAFLLATL